jgi:hypothetical protein
VEVGTAVPGAQTVEVVLAGGHLLVGDFVREEAVLVEAGALQEPSTDEGISGGGCAARALTWCTGRSGPGCAA